MSYITIQKYIPTTSTMGIYGTLSNVTETDDIAIDVSGDTALVTITLVGAEKFNGEVKNNLVKIPNYSSKSKSDADNSDTVDSKVLSLKNVEFSFNVSCYLTDGTNYTAWKKLWMLVAMCSAGNVGGYGSALLNFSVCGTNYSTSNLLMFLEKVSFDISGGVQTPESYITNSSGNNVLDSGRIMVGLSLFGAGEER